MTKDPMTTTEAAEYLGISPEAIRQAISRKTLKAEKRGRDNFISRAELDRYRREHLGKVGKPPAKVGKPPASE
jgi:excisionase family DNA binding protein